MMCYYLNVQFQGQKINIKIPAACFDTITEPLSGSTEIIERCNVQQRNQSYLRLRSQTYRGADKSLAQPGSFLLKFYVWYYINCKVSSTKNYDLMMA